MEIIALLFYMQIYGRNNNLVHLYQPNLLINGDFQINQRGKSEYNFSTTGNYGLDMWQQRHGNYVNALIVKQVDNGVELTCEPTVFGGLRQYLSLTDHDVGKPFTLCLSVNGERKFETFTLSNQTITLLSNDIYVVEIAKVGNMFALTFMLAQTSTREKVNIVDYIDLFSGYIAYPHVKEDYATALMRCQRFLYPITSGQYSGIGEIVKYYDGYYVTFLPIFMANVSSVISNIDRITAYAFSNGQGNQFVTIKSILFNNTNRTLLITLNEKLNLANGTTLLFQTLNTDDYMYLSCEPN